MMPASFVIFHVSIIVLLMVTFTTTTNIPQSTSMVGEVFQPYDDEQNSAPDYSTHHQILENLSSPSKHIAFDADDDENLSNSDEEYNDDYPRNYYNKAFWPQILSKRYTTKITHGGSSNGNGVDSRVWAIPYRFGKRAAMPYRFGKRAGMHFRLGKKSASL